MAARKTTATRTVNPLHFEDLEPKRFEDLVRQLAYSFRSWRLLEPTGLLGDDEGIDILGVEVEPEESATERRWRFQCKRYKKLTPKEVRAVVHEVVPRPEDAPHGLVIAAACNFTSDAILAFHAEAKQVGVAESHLWSKAKLEDLLFLPENDHLLFAYFGISLRTKRRGELEAIRHVMAIKRKLVSALGVDDLSEARHHDIIVRDVSDTSYPGPPKGKTMDRSWHGARTVWADHSHLAVELRRWVGWMKPDGTWDKDDESSEPHDVPELRQREGEEDRTRSHDLHRQRVLLEEAVPKDERVSVMGVGVLPYSRILEVDPLGDPGIRAPHVFCEYRGDDRGPYDGGALFIHRPFGGPEHLDDAKRDASLFKMLRQTTDLSEAAWDAHWKRTLAETNARS